jgi:pimeloyl-ACP methyl ester carboxylesterase
VERYAQHYQVIVPDLRGHGRSTNPSGVFSHRQSALDVFAMLDQLGVTRFKAMGISTGGMTLLHMATQQRERVEAMVLIGATSYFPEQARAIMRQAAADSLATGMRQMYAPCATRGEAQIRELQAGFGRFKDSYDDMNFTAPYLASIKARTLIVHGDRDEFFPVAIPVEMYQAIPGSALWIIPRGNHVPIFGPRQREFEEVTLDFLKNAPPPR